MEWGATQGRRLARSREGWRATLGRAGFWWLIAILALAALIRAATLSFGLPSLNDQDELMFELGAVKMLRGHTLNPGWFGHPATTTMYVLALVDAGVYLVGLAFGWWRGPAAFTDTIYHDPTWVMLPGRAAMACFGVLTIALTARLGARLFGRRAGLIAALLLALCPLHVAYSQIIRSDMMACAFVLLAMLAALHVADAGRWRDFALGGMWSGIATATKWPFALGMLAVIGAAALRWFAPAERRSALVARTTASVAVALGSLFAASPFLLLAWPTVVRNLRGEGFAIHLGATGGSFAWNAGWYLAHPLRDSFGIGGLGLAALGCGLIAGDRRARAILGPVALGFIVVICWQYLVWARWALPLLPPLAIGIGAAATWLADCAAARGGARFANATLALLGAAVLIPMARGVIDDGAERINDTRQQASRWVIAHVPPGKSVLIEHFGWDLTYAPLRLRWPVGAAGCLDPMMLLSTKVSYQTVEKLREGRTNIDYGTVAPDKRASCRADYAILSQYDRYAAERDRFPQQYRMYRELLDHARTVALFRPEPGVSGGWTVRVVRFDPAPR